VSPGHALSRCIWMTDDLRLCVSRLLRACDLRFWVELRGCPLDAKADNPFTLVMNAPRFDRDWKSFTALQPATSCKVVTETFVPDLAAPGRPFRPGLCVKAVTAQPSVFEMTWDNCGRATFSPGEERIPGSTPVIWRRVGTHAIFTPPPGP
jgi:hypothetical protein